MQPQPLAGVHPFTPILHEWRQGIKVDCGPDWSWSAIEAVIACGPHPTACTQAAVAIFQEDIAYQVEAGFSKVLLWEDIKQLRPANLKISPVALVPQTGRRGRIILDLSFPVYQEVNGIVTVTQDSVNSTLSMLATTMRRLKAPEEFGFPWRTTWCPWSGETDFLRTLHLTSSQMTTPMAASLTPTSNSQLKSSQLV